MAGYKIFYFKCLSIPHIWLRKADTSCLTLTYNIIQDMKIAGILQNGPWKDVCAQSLSTQAAIYLLSPPPSFQTDLPLIHRGWREIWFISLSIHHCLSLISRLPWASTCAAPGNPWGLGIRRTIFDLRLPPPGWPGERESGKERFLAPFLSSLPNTPGGMDALDCCEYGAR